jgi:hypothetical protein
MRIILLFILALLCTGCPQRRVTRTAVLAGLTDGAQTSATVSVPNPEVQSALKIIDGVLASHGFVQTVDTNLTVYGSLVTYTKYTPEGYGTIFPSIAVSLDADNLEFSVANRPDLTLEDKQILKAVRTELRSHYGAKRVKTRH